MPLTDDQLAALWAEHDRLRSEVEHFQELFDRVNDRLLADLKARTGFPRRRPEATERRTER